MSKFKGQVVFTSPTKQVSDKFKKRAITLKTDGDYPQYVTFDLTQDKCELADNVKTGDVIEVSYELKGRSWEAPDGTTKYFNTVEAWTINLCSPIDNLKAKFNTTTDESSDDLPF